jgi:hypothetical protein
MKEGKSKMKWLKRILFAEQQKTNDARTNYQITPYEPEKP